MKKITKYTLHLIKESYKSYDIIDTVINSTENAYKLAKELNLDKQTEETVFMIALDIKKKIIGYFEVSRGSLEYSLCNPREIYKRALSCNALSIILFHNHPSGQAQPSPKDDEVTKAVLEAGNILGIKLLDHIIVGDNKWYSYLKESDIFHK